MYLNYLKMVFLAVEVMVLRIKVRSLLSLLFYSVNGLSDFQCLGTLRIGSSKEVMIAMKFTPEEDKENAKKEYEMYTYLDAINNASVEAYGIPSVYYYGQWNDCYLMAITLLDTKSYKMYGPNGINHVDVLIVFREFVSKFKVLLMNTIIKNSNYHFYLKVRITKYLHSHGVCHNDIKLDNIMFRNHQGFIIGKFEIIFMFMAMIFINKKKPLLVLRF